MTLPSISSDVSADERRLLVATAVALAATVAVVVAWRDWQLRWGKWTMRKLLAVALQRTVVQSLEHARFGRWDQVDPAKELGDGASASSAPSQQPLRDVFGSKRSNNSQRSNSQRSSSQRSNSQRSTGSNRASPTPALDKAAPFREYVWRGGLLVPTKRPNESPRRMQPVAPAPPPGEQPESAAATTSAVAPVPMQTRYVGGRLPPTYQGSTYTLPAACSSSGTRAPVTTAEVLRSANGRRSTHFFVTTRRGLTVAPAQVQPPPGQLADAQTQQREAAASRAL